MVSCLTTYVEAQSLDPSELTDDLLCSTATYGMVGRKRWKIENYDEYINEAKKRELNCGVPNFVEGNIKEISNIDIQLMLAQLGVYSGEFDGIYSESLVDSTKRLLAMDGFSYIDEADARIPTFIYKTHSSKFSEEDFGDFYCEQVISKKLLTDDVTDVYLCELNTTTSEIQSLTREQLCELATIRTTSGKVWGVREKSIYVNQALENGFGCDVSDDIEPKLSVRQIQTRLTGFGYNTGPIDGLWGRKTEEAFSTFIEDNYQSINDPKSQTSMTFLSHYFDQKFNQPVTSGINCKDVIPSYQRGLGQCVVFAKFDEVREIPDNDGTAKTVWDLTLPLVDYHSNENPMIVMVGPDIPVPFTEPYDGPGKSHLARFEIDLTKIFGSTDFGIKKVNASQELPFSSRRHVINDLNNDGHSDLIFTASREDGRGITGKLENGTYANMLDYNFIYDLQKDELIKFGKRRFSHDYGIFDFNGDGYKEYVDFSLDKPHPSHGFDFCDGKTLTCEWISTNQFVNGNTWMAYDLSRGVVNLMATCGERYIENSEHNSHYCVFDTTYSNGRLQFNLVSKLRLFPKYNINYNFKNFFGKVDVQKGYTTEQSDDSGFFYRPQNFHTQQIDLNGDGQPEILLMLEELVCTINDDSDHIYSYGDCPDRRFISRVYSYREDGYYYDEKLSEINFTFNTVQGIDLNNDGENDLVLQAGGCNPTSWPQYESLIGLKRYFLNKGNGEYAALENGIISAVDCNLGEVFFERDEEVYRVFKFKNSAPEDAWRDTEVFLAIEQVLFDRLSVLSDNEICKKSISYKFSAGVQTAKWSTFPQDSEYVFEAQKRGLSCKVDY